MVQRWSIALSAYDYTFQHKSAKQIQHVDYISRQSLQDRPVDTSDCLSVQSLPVRRSDLIRETRRYFGCMLSAIRKGWNAKLKRRFPVYFSKRDELSTTPDGILCLNYCVVIPPSLRKSVLEDLHSGHLGKCQIVGDERDSIEAIERKNSSVAYEMFGVRRSYKLSTEIVPKNIGKSLVRIPDINDLSTHNRHVDQIQFQEPGESVPILVVDSNDNEHSLDNTESLHQSTETG
ncbi:unnamed protein product [Schistosoma curassoni]|uniref:DUF5641 domain-containing protein n=1 Tax=Schistosoma curassoni TaxID=6186 RepID=A0A183JT67_9TREM|nr:unnamed protein product [Schistosoma curassoni]